MRVLVASLVVSVKKLIIRWRGGDEIRALLCRSGQLLRLTTADRQAENIENPCLVRVKQDRAFILGEGAAADADRVHELLDRVMLRRAGRRALGFWRGCRSLREHGNGREKQRDG